MARRRRLPRARARAARRRCPRRGRAVCDALAAHDLDGWVITLADARTNAPPVHQVDPMMRDHEWALHSAHVHAGRYFLATGLDPRDIVPEPTWDELLAALRAAFGFVDAHPE